jgi:hypothetical protein
MALNSEIWSEALCRLCPLLPVTVQRPTFLSSNFNFSFARRRFFALLSVAVRLMCGQQGYLSTGMWRRIVWWVAPDVSKYRSAFIFRAKQLDPRRQTCCDSWNVENYSPNDTASHPGRHKSEQCHCANLVSQRYSYLRFQCRRLQCRYV